jgi:hypothetical protein
MDQAKQTATTSGAGPGGATPLLRTLGGADAAVCTDGFCEVPAAQETAPGQPVTTGDGE